jgi:hypothetical protein
VTRDDRKNWRWGSTFDFIELRVADTAHRNFNEDLAFLGDRAR